MKTGDPVRIKDQNSKYFDEVGKFICYTDDDGGMIVDIGDEREWFDCEDVEFICD